MQNVVFGNTHVRADARAGTPKTTITPAAAASVSAQASGTVDAGTFRFGSGPNDMALVPRASQPTQFRLIGSHHGGGGAGGPTSFPVDNGSAMAAAQTYLPSGSTVVHAPDTPPSTPRAASASSAPPPLTL